MTSTRRVDERRDATVDEARQILESVLSSTPYVNGLVVVGAEGQVHLTAGSSREALVELAPFAIGLHDLSSRLTEETGTGRMEYHLMRASEGLLVVHAVGHSELLLGIVDADAPLGTAVHDLGWCAARLGEQR